MRPGFYRAEGGGDKPLTIPESGFAPLCILHKKLGLTTIMITHDMTEAILLADRVAVMRSGKLLAQGTPTELSKSTNPYVGELLGTPRRQAERLQMLLPTSGAA